MSARWAPCLVSAILLSACSKPAEDGRTVLRLGWPNDVIGVQPLLRRFQEDHPDIRIEVRTYPAFGGQAAYENKVKSDLLAGEGPDVFALPDKEAPFFAHEGLLMDLRGMCGGKDGVPLSDFYPQTLQSWTYDGGLAGLPYQWAVGVLIVNAGLFREAKIPLDDDWDWDGFVSVCQRLTKDLDGDGETDRWAFRRAFPDYALIPIWASGGEVLDPEGRRVLLDSPEAVRAIRWYSELSTKHRVVLPFSKDLPTINEAVDLFASRRVAMMEAANWFVKFMDQVRSDPWEIMRFPRCPATGKRATRIAADAVAVWKRTPHPREAFLLAKAFVEDPWQRSIAQAGEFIPSRRSIAESPSFLRDDTPWDEGKFLRALDDARVFPRIPEFNVLRRTLKNRLEAVWIPSELGKTGGDTPERACERMRMDLQRAMDARERNLGGSEFLAPIRR